jgi:hypothetical protein
MDTLVARRHPFRRRRADKGVTVIMAEQSSYCRKCDSHGTRVGDKNIESPLGSNARVVANVECKSLGTQSQRLVQRNRHHCQLDRPIASLVLAPRTRLHRRVGQVCLGTARHDTDAMDATCQCSRSNRWITICIYRYCAN